MTGCHYFLELPVYRLTQREYDADSKVIMRVSGFQGVFARKLCKRDPKAEERARMMLWDGFGGIWKYNEIVGHIRLHYLCGQARGEYFAVSKKAIRRSRTRRLEFQTWKLAPEIDIKPPYGHGEILSAVRRYVRDCKGEIPRRHIDTELLDKIPEHMDWPVIVGVRLSR